MLFDAKCKICSSVTQEMSAYNSRKTYFHSHRRSPMIIIVYVLFLALPSRAKLSFNFTSFNPNNHDLNYSGDAAPSSPAIQLTRNQQDKEMHYSTGRVTYQKLFHLWDNSSGELADFTTRFTFIINAGDQELYGDGLAFFLAPDGFEIPSKQEGGGIGLAGGDQVFNSSLNPFVAVEFDTFQNVWDPVGDHVGININSMISAKNVTWSNLVAEGQMNTARVTYNSSAKRLSVAFTGFDGDQVFTRRLSKQVDLRECLPENVSIGFSASTGDYFEIHTLHSWDFDSSLPIDERSIGPIVSETKSTNGSAPIPSTTKMVAGPNNARTKVVLGIGLGLGVSVCALVTGFFIFCSLKKKMIITGKKNEDEDVIDATREFGIETGPKKFTYKQLALATKNFEERGKIGQGGFGGVYKGFLKEIQSYAAVKKISSGSKQGIKEYAAEVKTISRLRHRNLVSLIGWCHEGKELLLVYEFMSNGSLDSHLFKETGSLTWSIRYNVVRGLASALLYLQEEWEQCVLHRDIKSSNIMLDSSFNAKLGDFGLARLVDHEKGSQTTILAGTMGYMAPECILTGKAGKVSDVYSFGVVALEIASGKKPLDPMAKDGHVRLVDHVWEVYRRGEVGEVADLNLNGDYDDAEMERLITVGLWCAHTNPNARPSIKQAIQVLNFEAPLPNLSKPVPSEIFATPIIKMSAFWSSPSIDLTGSGSDDTGSTKLTSSSSASSTVSLICRSTPPAQPVPLSSPSALVAENTCFNFNRNQSKSVT